MHLKILPTDFRSIFAKFPLYKLLGKSEAKSLDACNFADIGSFAKSVNFKHIDYISTFD